MNDALASRPPLRRAGRLARSRLGLALVAGFASAASHAATYELSIEAAVRRAQERSPAARHITLEARRDELLHRGAQRDRWPELGLELQAPIWGEQFGVEALSTAQIDTVVTPDGTRVPVTRQVFGKTTTRRRNASGGLHLQQLLPWRGALSASSSLYYRNETTTLRPARRDYWLGGEVGLDLKLLGDDAVRRALHRTDVEWEMARARQRASRAELEFQTVSQYLALLRARLSLDIVRSAAAEATRAHELARRKVEAGLLPEAELLRMGVSRAEREARLAEAESELARSADTFKIFLGMSPSDSLVLAEKPAPFELHVELDQSVRQALERRPELEIAARDLELLERDRRALRPHVPDIVLSMRYGGAANESELDRALRSLSANDVSLQLGLSVPLWDAGRRALQQDGARTGIELQSLEADELRARIELEVRDAARRLQDAARRFEIFEASTHLAEESLRISGERYERGLIDTAGYVGAQTDAATARLGRTEALLDLYQARARLRLATMSGE